MAYIQKEQRSSRYTLSYYYGVKSFGLTKGLSEKPCTRFDAFGYISSVTCKQKLLNSTLLLANVGDEGATGYEHIESLL